MSYVGHVRGGTGSYTAQTKVIDAERTLASGQGGRLITIPGIGSVFRDLFRPSSRGVQANPLGAR